MRVVWVFLFSSFMLVSGCGGSLQADSNDTNQPQSPLANVIAPDDFSVNERTSVALTARGRGQTTTLTYRWQVTPTLTINHADTSVADASFQAPLVVSPSAYRFTVTVTDGNGNTASDDVLVTIVPVNEPPIAAIEANQIDGFAQNTYPAGETIILDASSSVDADPPTGLDPIASYDWQQTSGPDVTQGVSLSSDVLEFTAPVQDPASTLTFLLTVTDQEGAQDTTEISLNVYAASDTLPTVSAGQTQQVQSGDVIFLTGSATSVNPNAFPLSYQWLNDSQLRPQIINDIASQTYAIAPTVSSTDSATFTLEVTDILGNQVDDSVDVVVTPAPIARLNDTGVTIRTDNDGSFTVPVSTFPGQDADNGRDSAAQNGLLAKAGRGDRGFDYTRIDMLGDETDVTGGVTRCVRDNLTGLIWEVKQAGDAVQDNAASYTWFQSANTGGYEGVANGSAASCGISTCDTSSYITAINAMGLCGAYDWRLPTVAELLSIVHYGRTLPPLIDQNYFPNAINSTTVPQWYWTSVSSAEGSLGTAQNAWAVDFNSGNDNFLPKASAAYIRLVRGGRQ